MTIYISNKPQYLKNEARYTVWRVANAKSLTFQDLFKMRGFLLN